MAGTGTAHLRAESDVLLRVEDLVVEFHAEGGRVKAVSGISLDIVEGETLGLVGESGCGKSTTARAVMQLPRPTSGRVRFDGVELTELQGDALRRTRPRMQMIFQDPISSLNPRRKVGDIVAEGLDIWGVGDAGSRRAKVDEMLGAVGLDPDSTRNRRPHEFSGGQCQRISIARARHHRTEADHLRRAGVGARRVGAGADPQPPRGDEAAVRPHHAVHRPRPRGGEERERSGRGDVPRQALRGRPARPALRAARAPVHRRTAGGDPGARSRLPARRRARARRRHPVEHRPAERLPLPHPVPEGAGPLRRGGAVDPRTIGPGQYVACHFPLAPGELVEFAATA